MAVTAYPVILVDSTGGGSDDTASGAGPSTALTGTSASYSGSVFTLDGSPDLAQAAVTTTGDSVIYVQTSTGRRFFAINAKDNGASTVTVEQAPAGTATGLTWGIGGVRSTIGSSGKSKLLFSADLLPGWTVEMQSGHTETLSSLFSITKGGDATTGKVTLRGAEGAATRPVLTFSNNGTAIESRNSYIRYVSFDMKNSNATKTSSKAFIVGGGSQIPEYNDIRVADSTDNFGVAFGAHNGINMLNCEIGYCADDGIQFGAAGRIQNCFIHDCGAAGIDCSSQELLIYGCIFYNNTGAACAIAPSGDNGLAQVFCHNTVHGNGGDGLIFNSFSSRHRMVDNNIFSNNSGYGINMGTTVVDALSDTVSVRNNCFYSNSSGKYTDSAAETDWTGLSIGETTDNPSYVDAAGGDFSIGRSLSGLRESAYPYGDVIGSGSSTYSYIDIGAAQAKSRKRARTQRIGH